MIDLTEWEVEQILAHRVRKGDLSFKECVKDFITKYICLNKNSITHKKVRWKYWSSDYDSWEPKEHLTNCPEIIEAYVDTLSEKQKKKILEQ